MNIIEILTDLGIEEDAAKKAERAINKEIPQEFVKKDQYNKKVLELDNTKKDLSTAQSALADAEAFKTKVEDKEKALSDLQEQFDQYKTEQEAKWQERDASDAKKDLTDKKRQAARADLLKRQVSADVLDDFLLDKLDFDAMELDGEDVKDADAYMKPYQERYAKYFGKVETKGAGVGNPPANNGGEKNPWLKENKDIDAQSRIYKEDPQRARQMAAAAGITLR